MSIRTTKTVHTSKYFKVVQKEIERNGKNFTKDFIEKNAIVVIIPYTKEYEIYMEWQFRDVFEKHILETVAGTIEGDDDPLTTAKRELEEEAGLTAKTWKKIAEWETSSSMQGAIHLFASTDLTKGKQQLDDDEEIQITRVPLAELLDKID